MTSDLISEAAREAIKNVDKEGLKLGFVYQLYPGSNIWRIQFCGGHKEIELCLYVFNDSNLEQIVDMVQCRLEAML